MNNAMRARAEAGIQGVKRGVLNHAGSTGVHCSNAVDRADLAARRFLWMQGQV